MKWLAAVAAVLLAALSGDAFAARHGYEVPFLTRHLVKEDSLVGFAGLLIVHDKRSERHVALARRLPRISAADGNGGDEPLPPIYILHSHFRFGKCDTIGNGFNFSRQDGSAAPFKVITFCSFSTLLNEVIYRPHRAGESIEAEFLRRRFPEVFERYFIIETISLVLNAREAHIAEPNSKADPRPLISLESRFGDGVCSSCDADAKQCGFGGAARFAKSTVNEGHGDGGEYRGQESDAGHDNRPEGHAFRGSRHGLLGYQIFLLSLLCFGVAFLSGGLIAIAAIQRVGRAAKIALLGSAVILASFGFGGVVWLIYDAGPFSVVYWARDFLAYYRSG